MYHNHTYDALQCVIMVHSVGYTYLTTRLQTMVSLCTTIIHINPLNVWPWFMVFGIGYNLFWGSERGQILKQNLGPHKICIQIFKSHNGKGHHNIGRHLSGATKLHECHPPLTWRPYLSSLRCRLPLHVASDATPLPTVLSPIAHMWDPPRPFSPSLSSSLPLRSSHVNSPLP